MAHVKLSGLNTTPSNNFVGWQYIWGSGETWGNYETIWSFTKFWLKENHRLLSAIQLCMFSHLDNIVKVGVSCYLFALRWLLLFLIWCYDQYKNLNCTLFFIYCSIFKYFYIFIKSQTRQHKVLKIRSSDSPVMSY